KIGEIEKPLSEEDKERMLYKLRDLEYRKYAILTITIMVAFFLVIFLIVQPWGGLVFGPLLIFSIVGTVYAKRRYDREKEKVSRFNLDLNDNKNTEEENKNEQKQNEKQD
ncbi:MAG: hypothetical protein K2G31_04940, partial [Clostridia bacterium]|nr:hypothetical protein [Clostridia bacterium]